MMHGQYLPFRLLVCFGLMTLPSLTACGAAAFDSTAAVFFGAAFFGLPLLLSLRTCFGGLDDAGFGGAADANDAARLPSSTSGAGKGSEPSSGI